MAQIVTKFITNLAVTAPKLGSGAATATQTLFANGSGGATYRNILATDLPSLSGTYLALAGGTMSGALNMGSNQINALATPTLSTDAATKGYVDAAISGLTWKGPVQAYAASNVPLTGGATLTIDGHSMSNGDLVLLANQTTASQNGEYVVSGIGSSYVLTSNGLPNAIGDAWLVEYGTVYANSAFVATAVVPAATFVEFAGPTAYTFSSPLAITGSTVSIQVANTSQNGYLSSADWNTFNGKQAAGSYITALTGDATASGPGSAALTLATVNSNVGSFGSSSSVPIITVNGKGLITAVSTASIVAGISAIGTFNSQASSANGLTISGTTLYGQAATTTNPGMVSVPAAGGLSLSTAALSINVDNVTAKITGSNTLEALQPAEEKFTLSSTNITNQYVDLAHVIFGSSASVNSAGVYVVGGPEQQKAIDYTVSLTGGAGGVTRITFAGDLATGGNAQLVAGDILVIDYSYLA